ncbi:MAG: serine/threonine protein kinase [Euryarchaeota archaeon]|nr:serine/threonine protein kinase [Euryarchaeota archaeon]
MSALAVAALGLVTLRGGKSRSRGALAFGMFALFWGVQIVLINLATLVQESATAEFLYLLTLAFNIPLGYLLVSFAISQYPRHGKTLRTLRVFAASILGLALAAIFVLFVRPQALFEGTIAIEGTLFPMWGTWFAPLIIAPFFGSFIVAVIALHLAQEKAATPRIRKRLGFLRLGLGVFVSFAAANNVVVYYGISQRAPTPTTTLLTIVFALLSAAVLAVVMTGLYRMWTTRSPAVRRDNQLVVLAHLVPFILGVVEGIVVLTTYPNLNTVGIWRLGSVAILAYGLAHWRTHDLPQRTARGTATAAGITGSFAGGAAGWGIGTLAFANPFGPIALGLLFMGATVAPFVKFARRLVPQRWQTTAPGASEALYGQKIDAYRAALEASLARGTLHDDREFLFALKDRFGITDDEERILLHLARTSVLVPSKGDTNTIYEKLRLLGEGGSGRTWLVRDRVQERLVVLKEPLERWQNEPTLRERVLREARLAAKVRHPNVVQIEEVVESKDTPIIVMEHIDGGSLLDLVRDQGVLPWRQAVDIMDGVLDGLEAVHATGIIHRDIKPSNILLTSDGEAKVSDFGIALPAASTRTLIDPKEAGAGTRAYMAPEMLSGRSTGTRQSDVYACAAMLYECLYGAPPTPHSVVFAQKDIPLPLIAAIERGLSERPEDRFPSVKAFAEALRQAARA